MKLTREEILAMEPGRELDIAVAVNIMGYTVDRHRQGLVSKDRNSTYPKRYSSDISAAWEVVEKIPSPFCLKRSYESEYGVGELGWLANWCIEADCDCLHGGNCCREDELWSKYAPEVISKAALIVTLEAEK